MEYDNNARMLVPLQKTQHKDGNKVHSNDERGLAYQDFGRGYIDSGV